ncbi:MAG: carbohydrate binding domain-containing protein [Planctomycetota bacterium]|nr:carbohydrate binding domain-containing protein [Planctomycetota bacterium]
MVHLAKLKSGSKSLHRSKDRSGTIYVMAMGTSLIVVCLAVASLQSVRVQRRMNDSTSQAANARKLAQSGLEFVQHRILTDTGWRSQFANGVPVSRTTTGGSFSVTLTDPDDGIVANQTTDPIIVTSVGTFGSAQQTATAYLEPQNQLYAACRSAIYATQDIEFDKCNATSNNWVFSNDKIKATGNPAVNLNCHAANGCTGNGYLQRKRIGGVWPMKSPDFNPTSTSYVGSYYLDDNAVALGVNDLPTGGTELIVNGGFETNTSNWTTSGCTLTRDTAVKRSGTAACLVSGRSLLVSSPVQNITAHMLKGRNYTVSFWVRAVEDQVFYPTISISYSGSALPLVISGEGVSVDAGTWKLVTRTLGVTWSGTLTNADLEIRSSKSSNYHIDGVSLLNNDRLPGTRYIENVLFGSSSNPFGSGIVSANGVYSIDASGQDLLIRDCRINGTILVLNANKVEIENAISWEPVGRNFPAIIANAPLEDRSSNYALSEAAIGVNLNPSTAPYLGNSNTVVSESYPSVITGPIIAIGDVILDGVAKLTGPVMTPQKVTVTSNDLEINFPSDMILNPPPGFFADPPKMRLNTSSIQ